MDQQRCKFCHKLDNKRSFIGLLAKVHDVNSNLLVIAIDVLNVAPASTDLICIDCKNKLIESYKFITRAVNCFGVNSRLTLTKSFHDFLNESVNPSELTVMKYNQCLAIVTPDEKAGMEYQGWLSETSAAAFDIKQETVEIVQVDEPEIKQEVNQEGGSTLDRWRGAASDDHIATFECLVEETSAPSCSKSKEMTCKRQATVDPRSALLSRILEGAKRRRIDAANAIHEANRPEAATTVVKQEPGEDDEMDYFLNESDEANNDEIIKASNQTQRDWLGKQMQKSRSISTPGAKVSKDILRCWICGHSAKYHTLRYHLLKIHFPAWQLGADSFGKHLQECKVTTVKLSSIRCNFCNYQYRRQKEYLEHIHIHRVTDPIAVNMSFPLCSACPMRFSSEKDLQLHKIIHQREGVSEAIPAEGLGIHKWAKENVLTVELHKSHNSWRYTCGHCEKKFETKLDVDRHIMLFHMNPIVCPFDQQKFERITPLLVHVNSCHPKLMATRQRCSNCEEDFNSYSAKLAHSIVCKQKKLMCDCCMMRFGNKVHLLKHLRERLGISDYTCHFCAKSFGIKSQLDGHLRSHSTKQKSYNCTLCQESFISLSALADHRSTHDTLPIPYQFQEHTKSQVDVETQVEKPRKLAPQKPRKYNKPKAQKVFCRFCSEEFINVNLAKMHMKLTHKAVAEPLLHVLKRVV